MCEKYILAKIFYYYTSTQFLFVYIQKLSKLNKASQAQLCPVGSSLAFWMEEKKIENWFVKF